MAVHPMSVARRAGCSGLIVILAGCAAAPPMVWRHPSRTDMSADSVACEYEATKAVAGIRSAIEHGVVSGKLQRMCLQQRGWHLVPST